MASKLNVTADEDTLVLLFINSTQKYQYYEDLLGIDLVDIDMETASGLVISFGHDLASCTGGRSTGYFEDNPEKEIEIARIGFCVSMGSFYPDNLFVYPSISYNWEGALWVGEKRPETKVK